MNVTVDRQQADWVAAYERACAWRAQETAPVLARQVLARQGCEPGGG